MNPLTFRCVAACVALLTLVAFVFPGCSGGKTKTSSADSVLPVLEFQNEHLSFNYGSQWTVSGRTENSIVLTHRERPGKVMLSARWLESRESNAADVVNLYKNQLGLLAADVRRLEDINIGNTRAERYASAISGSGVEPVATMHVLFSSGTIFYLVTFSADPDDFAAYANSANRVIESMKTGAPR